MEVETVVALVAGYQWRWQEQPLEVLASEKAFQGQLVNRLTKGVCRVFDIAGKIDGIVKLEDGRIAVLEHKLQSDDLDPGSDYWRRLQMDLQVSFYVYAARSLGFKVDTVLFDVARKPSIKPSAVPLVDEDGFKIVLDKDGQRVMTKDGKKPRESGDTAAGYTLQVRPMAADEWVDRLLEDIGNRPTWYYARQEVPRLDQDIDEMRDELWDLQNVLRDAQRNGRWYRTVTRECPFCPYFSLCTSKYDPQRSLVPDGFTFISNKHPELGDIDATNSSPT
jgi:CRISPR/Cas system-associated exonuclease Cas4 (RecB family)